MRTLVFSTTYCILMHILLLSAGAQYACEDEKGIMREMVMEENIRTIQIYREGWEESYPIMRLEGDVPLLVEFDDLGEDGERLYYRMVLCNADWTVSELSEMEYLDGYEENEIPGGTPSFNTYTSFMHYRLELPNQDVSPRVSGNYMLLVYRDMNPDDLVFSRRFMLTEAAVNIQARATRPLLQTYQGCCQEVNFTISHQGININDPWNECTSMILQNGVWDLALGPLQPYRINPGELVFESNEEYIFQGGNEFRFFDTKNTHTPTYYVKRIEFLHPFHHFELRNDEANPSHVYLSKEDINGRYHIQAEGVHDQALESDYVVVHFQLDMPLPLKGEVYVAGAMTNWRFTEENRMKYDPAQGAYRQSLLLKQGVYNYRYLFLPEGSKQFSLDEIEASFYETENEYLILFYRRAPGERYDRLLGHQIAHSNR